MLGLKRGVLTLSPYAPAWPALYASEAAQLRTLLGPVIIDMQHVGSTAIPGMIAKPILDIAVKIDTLREVALAEQLLPPHGYVCRGEQGLPGRHLFAKGDPVSYHVHMMLPDCNNWQNQVLFRDYLLTFPETATAYAGLKQALLATVAGDRRAYSAGKHAFITQTLHEAKTYFG